KDLVSTEYEVILSDGTEVDFNKDGAWKSIDRGQKAVPDALVLKPIRDYVAKAYPGQKIVDIEKDRKGYEITLTRGTELKFDSAGTFKKIDK
ncbi:MAG: PepSY-like domain-containing protein, partial [Duncaniella sp.]|nr:PepSY-like domain-containing protein [Duncaniella sp.]